MTRVLLLLCFAFVAIPRHAYAEDAATKTAKKHFDRGQKLFDTGRFDEALDEYQKAYDAKPLPDFLFNIGQCYRNLGDFDRAIFSYKKYLELSTDLDPDDKTQTEKLIHDLEKKQAKKPKQPPPTDNPPPPPIEHPNQPIYKKWWFAAGIAVIAVGAGIGIYELTKPSAPPTDLGVEPAP